MNAARISTIGAASLFQIVLGLPLAAAEQPARHVYFGDLHIHTRYSNDAAMSTERVPDDAYLYAKGGKLRQRDGSTISLNRPLDFLAVTDHAEFLGAISALRDPSIADDSELARKIRSTDPADRRQAVQAFMRALREDGYIPDGLQKPEQARTVWRRIVESADRHYAPGDFTTFAGFEWSPMLDEVANMHRCVIFEGTQDLPLPFSAVDSRRPEDLWSYMERQRMRGVDVLAIPHNANLSDGMMFALVDSYGEPLNENYAARRTWNEPVVEVAQTKGTSETHPLLSPNDEFAHFELFTQLLGTSTQGKASGSYVREAFLNGVRLQAESAFNPFMFGLVGGTDNHQAASQIEEDGYAGSGENYFTPKLRHERVYAGGKGLPYQAFSAAGLTAVWAGANTRGEIFASLRRRETYATSGPRITVRFFGSFSYTADVLEQIDWIEHAYRQGTSMGGVIEGRDADAQRGEGGAPKFIVWAARDPHGANLDRVQIIKGWYANGEAHEQVYDVALSDGRVVGEDNRAPPVGSTVDAASATYTNDIGATALNVVWTDPSFDPKVPAFYYARVIEIPTPRWATHDAAALGLPPRNDLPASLQERAFTSPIWYLPAAR